MELRGLFTSLLLFSGVVIGMSIFYSGIMTSYDVNFTDVGFLNVSLETQEQVDNLKSSIESSQITGTPLDWPLMAISAIYGTLKLTYSSLDMFNKILSNISSQLWGVPVWLTGIVIACITIFISFEIISYMGKHRV